MTAPTEPPRWPTGHVRLCDDTGEVNDRLSPDAPAAGGRLTYREVLNNLRAHTGLPPYEGRPFQCTGDAHLAGMHLLCTSPAHRTTPPAARFVAVDGTARW